MHKTEFDTAGLLCVLAITTKPIKLLNEYPEPDGSFTVACTLTARQAMALVLAGVDLGGYEGHGSSTRVRVIRPLFQAASKAIEPPRADPRWVACWLTEEAAVLRFPADQRSAGRGAAA